MTTSASREEDVAQAVQHLAELARQHVEETNPGWVEINLVDLLGRLRGWLPLQPGEDMVLHIGTKEYILRRNK